MFLNWGVREDSLDCKVIKPVKPKGNQPWIFTGRTEAEAPILWPPEVKNWLLVKTLMLGKTKGRRRRGPQRIGSLDGITDAKDMKPEQTPGGGDGQGSLVCCSPRSPEELQTTWLLNHHHHLTLVRMDTAKKSTNNKCWRVCEEKGTFLHHWWECKLVQPQWKTLWRFLRKLEIATIWSRNSTPGHKSRQNYNSKRYIHSYVRSMKLWFDPQISDHSTIQNNQDMETT